MTEEQCRTCASPTKNCNDPQFAYLKNSDCLDYVPREIPAQAEGQEPTLWERAGMSRQEYVRRVSARWRQPMRLVELVELSHKSDEPDKAFDEELDVLAKKYGIEVKFVDDYYHDEPAVKAARLKEERAEEESHERRYQEAHA